jgi:hypothetical protein
VIGHCSGCPLYEVHWYADPLRQMEKLSLYFPVLSWWTNSMFLRHSSLLFFMAWHLYCLERLCLFCNTATSVVLRKVIKETVVPEVQKIVQCVTSWKTGGLWVSFELCVSSVYSWFAKGDVKYGKGLPSICSVQLSKMWVGYRGTFCS